MVNKNGDLTSKNQQTQRFNPKKIWMINEISPMNHGYYGGIYQHQDGFNHTMNHTTNVGLTKIKWYL